MIASKCTTIPQSFTHSTANKQVIIDCYSTDKIIHPPHHHSLGYELLFHLHPIMNGNHYQRQSSSDDKKRSSSNNNNDDDTNPQLYNNVGGDGSVDKPSFGTEFISNDVLLSKQQNDIDGLDLTLSNNNETIHNNNINKIALSTNSNNKNESFGTFCKRTSSTSQVKSFFRFFSEEELNSSQQAARDNYRGLCAEDARMLHSAGAVYLPTDEGGVDAMPSLVYGDRKGQQCYYIEKQEERFALSSATTTSSIAFQKVGRFGIDATTKEGFYDKKLGAGSYVMKGAFSMESMDIEVQRKQRLRLNERLKQMCMIKSGELPNLSVRDAVELSRTGIAAEAQILRYMIINNSDDCSSCGGGAFIKSLACGTEMADVETGITKDESISGNIGQVVHDMKEVDQELLGYLLSRPLPQQKRISKKRRQPMACSSWMPDLDIARHGLTVLLMSCMLQVDTLPQVDVLDTPENKPPVFGNAFGLEVPIKAALAKLKGKSIFDDSLFGKSARRRAIKRIMMYIAYITKYGVWLYLDTNKAALVVQDDIGMVDSLKQLHDGVSHPQWTVEKEFLSTGDIIMNLDMGDDVERKIVVHGPPGYQGYAGDDLDLNIQMLSMNKRAKSNFLKRRLTDVLLAECDTIEDAMGDSCLDESVMSNPIATNHMYIWLIKNGQFGIDVSSKVSKNLLDPSENLFRPEFNPPPGKGGCMISNESDLLGQKQRKKDSYDKKRDENPLRLSLRTRRSWATSGWKLLNS